MIKRITLPISASSHAIAASVLLSIMFYGSGKSIQLLPIAWPWRMTLKFKVTW